MNQFTVVIPARYASTRFPAKPLANILGRPMIAWTVGQALASNAQEVIVATDHKDIAKAAIEAGAKVCMTPENLQSGTDRVAYVANEMLDPKVHIVNVQGDEPAIHPELINLVGSRLLRSENHVVTAVHPISNAQASDPNRVKCLFLEMGESLKAIDFYRKEPGFIVSNRLGHISLPDSHWLSESQCYQHMGIYGYRADILAELANLPQSPREVQLNLEQLRFMDNGYQIEVVKARSEWVRGKGVDAPEDIAILENILIGL